MSDDLVGSILDHNSLGQTFVNFGNVDLLKCGSQCATVPSANFLSLTLRLPENFPTVRPSRSNTSAAVEVREKVSRSPRRGENNDSRASALSRVTTFLTCGSQLTQLRGKSVDTLIGRHL